MSENSPKPDEAVRMENEGNEPADQAEDSAAAAGDALAAAQDEIGKLKDQILRAMAETENTRKRMKKEIEDAQKYAMAGFAKEMLGVADNFRRALEAIPKDAIENDTLKTLIEGVEATERQLLAAFERFGIKKIDPLGQPFDPHYHRVMLEMEDIVKPAGTVVQVFQPGYMIGERLLREAQVVVSKGGPPAHKVDTSA